MPDPQDLHQIEYRHHQTKDLSPFASSMSPDSLRAWDSRIRPWVRHPHADRLSESMCYQVFPNGQAAVAWRYWDQRAAERADGTRGRPLVSHVLVGQESVLTPDVAVALCLVGMPGSVGLRPGEATDGAPLPVVGGGALNDMTRKATPELDREALKQEGLQALVAAALADPATPLAISIRDVVIQRPLRESVQYPLLWGLRRIAGRLLGQGGRGWSFSTFEPPLGELDPASLPGIVFRQALDGAPTPPARWRKEIKVRPFASDALAPGLPYADRIELAGWLVAEYHKRGGDDLDRFIAECCGAERSVQLRLERVYEELRPAESPVTISDEAAPFVPVSSGRLLREEKPASAEPAPGEPERDGAGADEDPQAITAAPPPPAREPAGQAREAEYVRQNPAAVGEAVTEPAPSRTGELAHKTTRPALEASAQSGAQPAEGPERQPAEATAAGAQDTSARAEVFPSSGPSQDQGYGPRHHADTAASGYGDPGYSEYQSSTRQDRRKSLAPAKEGQAPPLGVSDRGGQQAGDPAAQPRGHWYKEPAPPTVSQLLKQLELDSNDAGKFESILRDVSRIGRRSDDPDDRAKSWNVISNNDWYYRINENHEFHPNELAEIFVIVVIPDLTEQAVAERTVRWAWKAPAQMIGGLLAAARSADSDLRQNAMHILEPVLAARWIAENSNFDLWDPDRILRGAADLGNSDNRRGVLGRIRRR